jgi:hypothetical protein
MRDTHALPQQSMLQLMCMRRDHFASARAYQAAAARQASPDRCESQQEVRRHKGLSGTFFSLTDAPHCLQTGQSYRRSSQPPWLRPFSRGVTLQRTLQVVHLPLLAKLQRLQRRWRRLPGYSATQTTTIETRRSAKALGGGWPEAQSGKRTKRVTARQQQNVYRTARHRSGAAG